MMKNIYEIGGSEPAITSWFQGKCSSCGYNVVVTQPDSGSYPTADYQWYCSNKTCKNHGQSTHTGDQ